MDHVSGPLIQQLLKHGSSWVIAHDKWITLVDQKAQIPVVLSLMARGREQALTALCTTWNLEYGFATAIYTALLRMSVFYLSVAMITILLSGFMCCADVAMAAPDVATESSSAGIDHSAHGTLHFSFRTLSFKCIDFRIIMSAVSDWVCVVLLCVCTAPRLLHSLTVSGFQYQALHEQFGRPLSSICMSFAWR